MRQTFARCVLSVIAGCTSLSLAGCGSRPPGAIASTNTVEIVIDANELVAAFEKASDRASEAYAGKRARISGYFARRETLDDGRAAIVFRTSIDTYRPLRCVNPIGNPDRRLDELDAGSPVTVDGTIGGFTESSYSVTVEECTLR